MIDTAHRDSHWVYQKSQAYTKLKKKSLSIYLIFSNSNDNYFKD